jgi:hypothetical protein
MQISKKGTVTFGATCTDSCAESSSSNFIAGFCDENISDVTLHYKELSSTDRDQNQRFREGKKNIMKHLTHKFGCSLKDFDPQHILVITWFEASRTGSEETVTFQIVLVSQSNTPMTYALLLYKDIEWTNANHVTVGFHNGSQTYDLRDEFNILELGSNTNVRRGGVYVYRIDTKEIIDEAEPLELHFTNDTPHVSGRTVTVNFTANRCHVHITCLLGNVVNRNSIFRSSGFFSHTFSEDAIWDHGVKRYTLYVKAIDTYSSQCVTLTGAFRVFGNHEKYFCSGNMVNTGTRPVPRGATVEYAIVGKTAENYKCKIDRNTTSCGTLNRVQDDRSIYNITLPQELSPGDTHDLIVMPQKGDYNCTLRGCRKRIKYSFMVADLD